MCNTDLLPRRPTSIANVAALLADGNLFDFLPGADVEADTPEGGSSRDPAEGGGDGPGGYVAIPRIETAEWAEEHSAAPTSTGPEEQYLGSAEKDNEKEGESPPPAVETAFLLPGNRIGVVRKVEESPRPVSALVTPQLHKSLVSERGRAKAAGLDDLAISPFSPTEPEP